MEIFSFVCIHYDSLLGWEYAYVCHELKTEKKTFTVNSRNIKQAIVIQFTFIMEMNLQKVHFYQNMTIFSAADVSF